MSFVPNFDNRIIVTQSNVATTLGGTVDSTKEYFIDGYIDCTGITIEVPANGINLRGFSFDLSILATSDTSHTLFTSPVGGSGNILGADYSIIVDGAGSQVYDIVSATGDEALEFQRINYINCTYGGKIDNYRQGLETGTGRFGGAPTLELVGVWAGGYRITTSIVRSLDAGMATPLFKAGAGFTMASRFLTDMNVDLPASASLLDFAPANFLNPSTLQLQGLIVTRNGVSNPEDVNLTPNIAATDLASSWSRNQGLNNTFVGGKLTISAEVTTTVSVTSTYYDIAGTWDSSDLTHFDEPSNGQLRHLGNNPRDFRMFFDGILEGSANDEVNIKVVKWDDSASSFVDVGLQIRQVNGLTGGRDVAFFNLVTNFELDQNDYIKIQGANITSTSNLTLELDSSFVIEQR